MTESKFFEQFHNYFDRDKLDQGQIHAVGKSGSRPVTFYHNADRWEFDPQTNTLKRLRIRNRK